MSLTNALDSNDDGKFKGDTCGTGICNGGTVVCTNNEQNLRCSSDNKEGTESCNGQDDDCDGSVDDNLTPLLASKQNGVCSGSVKNCSGISGWTEPNYTQITDYETTETSLDHCEGLDNDCDGVVDEACQCNYDNDSDGVCVDGTINILDGDCDAPANWVNSEQPPGQDCADSVDNDCDGIINELCPCTYSGVQGSSGICATGSSKQELSPLGQEGSQATVVADLAPCSRERCKPPTVRIAKLLTRAATCGPSINDLQGAVRRSTRVRIAFCPFGSEAL